MANYRQQEITYQPFTQRAILQDGLLAVARPGGEVADAVSKSLFGIADIAAEEAHRVAQRRGTEAGYAAGRDANPTVNVAGGDKNISVTAGEEAPPTVRDVISKAAARHGVSPAAMFTVAKLESNMDPAAKNKVSSAGGLFQQTDDNAAQYGITDRFDPAQSADAAARFMRDNLNYLTRKLDRAPTIGELYLAHQQGPGGAARLLANPNAPAASIVGLKAVIDNGGTATMTAGQFAAKWTQKAGNGEAGSGFGAMPIVDLEPDKITHGRDPLSINGGSGDLRLTGRDTIFGRAYDKAAIETYQTQLQDEMLTASSQLYEKFKDDPEGLSDALGQLREAQINDHVPDSIRADYDHAFSKISRRYMAQAQAGREAALKTEAQDQWFSQASKFDEGFGRAQVGLDPNNPDSFDVLQAEGNRLKGHYRDGMARGLITPKQANEAYEQVDRDVATSWYTQQATNKSPDDIEALRDKLKTDYAAGKLPGVDGKAWDKIDTSLTSMARAATQEASAKQTKLGQVSKSILDRAALGYQISPDEVTSFRAAANGVKNGDDVVSATMSVLDMAKQLRDEPVGAAEAKLAELKKSAGDTPNDAQVAALVAGENMIVKARKSLATDLLGHAERAGVIGNTGSFADIKSAQDVEDIVRMRIDAGQKAAQHFGVGEQYFKPGEVKMLEGIVKSDPEKGAAIAAALVKGSGDHMPEVLQAFGSNAPVLAGAGAILAGEGDMTAARDAIAGAGKDQNGKAYSEKGWQQRKQVADAFTGPALMFQPEDETRITGTAERIARKRIADAGIDPQSPEAEGVMQRALNEAAGAVYVGDAQYGGFANYDPWYFQKGVRVAVPNSIRADKLGDVIDAVRSDDLKVQPRGGLDAIKDQWPVLTAQGYVFVKPDQNGEPIPLAGEDGKPFYLDLEKLAARLGPRVVGSYRGY